MSFPLTMLTNIIRLSLLILILTRILFGSGKVSTEFKHSVYYMRDFWQILDATSGTEQSLYGW